MRLGGLGASAYRIRAGHAARVAVAVGPRAQRTVRAIATERGHLGPRTTITTLAVAA